MNELLPKKHPQSIGLIGHTIIGYPSFDQAKKIVSALVENGANLIELQIPFSEPVADGPIFSRANHQAIEQGVTVKDCFKFMQELTRTHAIPFVFMTYMNIIFKMGYEKFITAAKTAGARGAIIPDLPFEYEEDYFKLCKKLDFAVIPVIPPNMPTERLQLVCEKSTGFIYVMARGGVTGKKTHFDTALPALIAKVQQVTNLPIAVGFGISSQDDVQILKSYADYAIVGTETLRRFEQAGLVGVETLWKELSLAK